MVVSHGHRINASPYLDVGTGIELNFQDNLTQPIRAELPLWSCGAEGTSNPSDAPLLAPGTYQAVAVYDVSAQTVLVSKSVPLVVTPH